MRHWEVVTAVETRSSLEKVLNSVEAQGKTIFAILHRVQQGEERGHPWTQDCWDIVCYEDYVNKFNSEHTPAWAKLAR